jgi:hypothetical protein
MVLSIGTQPLPSGRSLLIRVTAFGRMKSLFGTSHSHRRVPSNRIVSADLPDATDLLHYFRTVTFGRFLADTCLHYLATTKRLLVRVGHASLCGVAGLGFEAMWSKNITRVGEIIIKA